jgi:hypothetical protein
MSGMYRAVGAPVAQRAKLAAIGVDTVVKLSSQMCTALKAEGVKFAVRYLGSLEQAEMLTILASGLALMPVTYAKHYSGVDAVAQLRKLGIPAGVTVWLDLEGETSTPADIIAKINAWAGQVAAAGYEPGLYVGAGCVLTSAELYSLRVVRYWDSCSREVSRDGTIAEPKCGWCQIQLVPGNTQIAGIIVDIDVIQQDFQGRMPTWVASSTG